MNRFQHFFILTIGIILFLSCNSSNDHKDFNESSDTSLGVISIEISCSKEASASFREGLLLLHSFQFTDAGEKFFEAQQLDASCGMAYWGEAMSQNHPLWREQDKEKANKILSRLGETEKEQRSAFKSSFEKDMFDAVKILYGKGPKKGNDIAYSTFMSQLHAKYPDNHEVHAFYALSLLGAVEDDRDKTLYEKGAKIAQSIIEENPQHPGALHYLIHSYDDPLNAHKALDAADRYAQVAPDAAHALHMPSHIYVALGKWDEVIKSNVAAVAASIKRQETKDLELKAIDFHSLKWQMYGHLQKGQFDKARMLVLQMQNYCATEISPKAVSHTVMMKAAYLSETNKWDDPMIADTIDYADVPIQIYGTRNYILGMEAFHGNKIDSLDQVIKNLSTGIANSNKQVQFGGAEMCSSNYDRSRPTINHVNRTKVMLLQLKANRAILNENEKLAEALMIQAIELEESTSYKYGPPEIVKPSLEMYGEWLHQKKRYAESQSNFTKVLERAPGRYISTKMIEKLRI